MASLPAGRKGEVSRGAQYVSPSAASAEWEIDLGSNMTCEMKTAFGPGW